MIVHLSRRRKFFPNPIAIPGIERVDKMNILRITVCHNLTFHHHISTHGLNGNALWDITRATLVSQLLYASPAWWGYLKADERNRLQSTIVKAIQYGYLPRSYSSLDELREDCDEQLFFSPRYNPYHVLHHLLPQSKNISSNLWKHKHNLTLLTDVNAVMKQNFAFRMLFTDIYWLSFYYFSIDICLLSSFSIFLLYIISHVLLSYFIKGLISLKDC